MQPTERAMWSVVVLSVVFYIGGAFGASIARSRGKGPIAEQPAPAVVHKDGSQTLERVVEPPPPPLPEPEGTTARTRVELIELQPMAERSTLQVDFLEMEDGTGRVTVKGPALVGGKDFPINPPRRTVHKWTVGAGAGFKRLTAIGARSIGPIDAGVMVQRDRRDGRDWDAQAFLLFRF